MARIIWTDPALADLNDIAEYIALDNHAAARRLVGQVFEKVERLTQFPESGRIPPELAGSQYREVSTGPCRIFYRSDRQNVYIVHIMRSERKLRQYVIENRANFGK